MRTGGAQEGSRQPHRPGDIQVHPSVKWTRGRAWPTARPAGFPCPSAKQASLDSRVSTPSCWGRVPSRVSFTNARPAQVGSWTGARSEVTSWLPQPPPGLLPGAPAQQTGRGPWKQGLLSRGWGPRLEPAAPCSKRGLPTLPASAPLPLRSASLQNSRLPLLVYRWPRRDIIAMSSCACPRTTGQLTRGVRPRKPSLPPLPFCRRGDAECLHGSAVAQLSACHHLHWQRLEGTRRTLLKLRHTPRHREQVDRHGKWSS